MRRTILKCDRCGREEEANERGETKMQLWGVQPVLYFPTGGSTASIHKRQDWCRECAIETGMLGVNEKQREEELLAAGRSVTPPPSFEDILREMLREIIQEEIPQN